MNQDQSVSWTRFQQFQTVGKSQRAVFGFTLEFPRTQELRELGNQRALGFADVAVSRG